MNTKYIKYIDYIVNDIEAPYFKNMRDQYGLSLDEYELVLSKLYNQPVTIDIVGVYDTNSVYDEQGNNIYYEDSTGFWVKKEYNTQGNLIYFENSIDHWEKYEFDDQGNKLYYENSNGFWAKREYDGQRNLIYTENSDGYWSKREYDELGYEVYYENSDGDILDYG